MNLVLAYAFVVIALIALWLGLQWYLGGGELLVRPRRERERPTAAPHHSASTSTDTEVAAGRVPRRASELGG